MGTFAGHVLPGSFFLLFALWWTIQMFRRYYQSLLKNGKPYVSSVTYPSSCLCGRLRNFEIEGVTKIFFCLVGFTGEIITGHHNGKFVYLGNGQHATMFFFFGLTGVIDILCHYRIPMPKNIDYVSVVLALSVEAVLFQFHLHGRTEMDVMLHTLLLYVVYANIVAVLLEMRYRSSFIASLVRTYFFAIQGTWFWQVGFILYNPIPGHTEWDGNDHEQMMICAMVFAWHMGAIFLIMLGIGGVVGCFYRCQGEFRRDTYDRLSMHLIKKDPNGHTLVSMHEDSDSDIEFQRPLTHAEVE